MTDAKHEAPADHHERNLTASNAELIEQALSHPPLEAPASEGLRIVDEASDTKPAMFEAPAEGAGLDLLSAIDAFMPSAEVAFLWSKETPPADEVQRYRERYWAVKDALLRARSSAPEAREGEAVAWKFRNMDLRQVGITMDKREADRKAEAGWEIEPLGLITHPAAPSADKLRIAVEALGRIAHEPRPVTRAAMREYAAEALAALKAEV